jgi:hypothetical protein
VPKQKCKGKPKPKYVDASAGEDFEGSDDESESAINASQDSSAEIIDGDPDARDGGENRELYLQESLEGDFRWIGGGAARFAKATPFTEGVIADAIAFDARGGAPENFETGGAATRPEGPPPSSKPQRKRLRQQRKRLLQRPPGPAAPPPASPAAPQSPAAASPSPAATPPACGGPWRHLASASFRDHTAASATGRTARQLTCQAGKALLCRYPESAEAYGARGEILAAIRRGHDPDALAAVTALAEDVRVTDTSTAEEQALWELRKRAVRREEAHFARLFRIAYPHERWTLGGKQEAATALAQEAAKAALLAHPHSDDAKVIYVLRLRGGYWYVGSSTRGLVVARDGRHISRRGAWWTTEHPPDERFGILVFDAAAFPSFSENTLTFELVRRCGIDYTRGGMICDERYHPERRRFLQEMTDSENGVCYNCRQRGHFIGECSNVRAALVVEQRTAEENDATWKWLSELPGARVVPRAAAPGAPDDDAVGGDAADAATADATERRRSPAAPAAAIAAALGGGASPVRALVSPHSNTCGSYSYFLRVSRHRVFPRLPCSLSQARGAAPTAAAIVAALVPIIAAADVSDDSVTVGVVRRRLEVALGGVDLTARAQPVKHAVRALVDADGASFGDDALRALVAEIERMEAGAAPQRHAVRAPPPDAAASGAGEPDGVVAEGGGGGGGGGAAEDAVAHYGREHSQLAQARPLSLAELGAVRRAWHGAGADDDVLVAVPAWGDGAFVTRGAFRHHADGARGRATGAGRGT